MANKKVVSVLSTAAIGTLIATAVGSTVFAAVDGLVVKNAAGAYLNYDLDALKASVVNDALGQAGAELYKDFDAARTAGSIVSYHDDKVGFVDAAAVQKAALDAALAGTNFALDTFTESSKETVLPATVYQATVTNGKVVAGAEVKPTSTPVATALAVESVSALNNKQVAIVFNQEVNSTDAENKAFYTRAGVALAGGDLVELQADKKTVIITLATAETNQTKAKFAVAKNLRAANGDYKLASKFEQEVTFADFAVPTVVKVEQNGPKGVKVYFNEPVTGVTSAAFNVDGGKYYASVGTVDDQRYSVELNFGTVLPEGQHTVVINKTNVVRDAAGLFAAETTMNFNMVKNEVAPTIVSAEAKSQTKVVLTFSAPLDTTYAATTVLTNYYHSATNYTPTSVAFVAGSNNTKLELSFTGNPLPAGNVALNIKKETVKDLFGNKNAVQSINVPVTVDSVKPAVTALNVKADNKLEVLFSESVVGATVASNYVIKNSAGEIVKNKAYANSVGNPVGTYTYSATEKKVTIDLAGNLPAGSYTLEVTGIKDSALVANIMDAATLSFTVTDTTAPTVTAAGDLIAAVAPNGQKVVIRFSEPMRVDGEGSILDPKNYFVSGAVLDTNSTFVAGNDNMSVIITLPTTTSITTGATVVVGRVKDAAGNSTAALSTNVTVTTSANIGVVAGSAKTTSITSVQFEVNYPLASIDASKFKVNNKTVVAASFENKILTDGVTSGSLVTLTVADADKWLTDATPAIEVTAAGSAKDSNGRDLAVTVAPHIATLDGTAPAIALDANLKKLIQINDADKDGKVDQAVITYTEALKADTISTSTYEVSGYTITGMALSAGNTVVTLTLQEKTVVDTAAVPTVRQVLAIKDANSNTKAIEETANDSLDIAKPYIKATSFDNATSTVTLVFSEAMDTATLDASAELTIGAKSLGASPTFTWSEDKKTVTIVGGTGFNVAATDTITATGAKDVAGNAVDLTSAAADADITF